MLLAQKNLAVPLVAKSTYHYVCFVSNTSDVWYSYVKDIWSDSHLIRVLVFFLRPFGIIPRVYQKVGCYCNYCLQSPFLYNICSHSFQSYDCCTRNSNVHLTKNLNLHFLLCVPWKAFIWWCQFMVLSCQWNPWFLKRDYIKN